MTDPLAGWLRAGPAHFPHSLDFANDRLLLLETDERSLSAASFLDQRFLASDAHGVWVPFAKLWPHTPLLGADDAPYIFHVGHCGSTLLARLLGRLPNVLSLREPLILRQVAEAWEKNGAVDAPWPPDEMGVRTTIVRSLLARAFHAEQRVIVKATSFVSAIAPELVAPQASAILLSVSAPSYLRTILAGEASRQEAATLAGPRLRRLARRFPDLPDRLWTMTEGQRVALGWAVEMLSLAAAQERLPPSATLRLDFDALLARPDETLLRTARHLRLPCDAPQAEALANDPLMSRYSKAPEHAYNAALRRDVQAQAEQQHGPEIRAGLNWIERLAARYSSAMAAFHEGI